MTTTSKTKSLEELTDEIIGDIYATKVELKNRIETLLSLARKEVIKEVIKALKLERKDLILSGNPLEAMVQGLTNKGYNQAIADLESLTKKFLEKENI